MNIITVCAFGIVSACIIGLVRVLRPELAVLAAAVAGVALTTYVIATIAPFISFIKGMTAESGVQSYFVLMLKALAISFCCKTSSEICRDCGENSLASRIELAGTASIVLISLPVVQQLLDIAKDMMG